MKKQIFPHTASKIKIILQYLFSICIKVYNKLSKYIIKKKLFLDFLFFSVVCISKFLKNFYFQTKILKIKMNKTCSIRNNDIKKIKRNEPATSEKLIIITKK